MNAVRPPAVAGTFYADDPVALAAEIEGYLAAAKCEGPRPKALIVPHAGYIYSGAVAASAYARLRSHASAIHKVLLLGPAHRHPFRGIALPSARAFASPLGEVPIDTESLARMAEGPGVDFLDAAHAEEHSLEVQLPFLQTVLDDFQLLPLLVGEADPALVESQLVVFGGGSETLIVVSSDLSHFLDYDGAVKADSATCHAIESLETENWARESACGRIPVLGLLSLARRLNMGVETLDLRNSGDTAGGRDRVVGYGAWAFQEKEDTA